MITTIIFDLSEVYLQGMKGIDVYLQKNHNLPLITKPLYIPELNNLFHGQISEDQFWNAVINKYQLQITLEELKKIVRENFIEIKGTRAIIEKLKKQGYKLGLLSVHAKEWIEYCEKKFDYHKLFNSVMYSFEVAVCKPDKEAFHLLLKELSAKPGECLFIDDSIENITAAKELGILTIHFTTSEQLEKELVKSEILKV